MVTFLVCTVLCSVYTTCINKNGAENETSGVHMMGWGGQQVINVYRVHIEWVNMVNIPMYQL